MIRPPCRLISTLWTLPLVLHLALATQQQQQPQSSLPSQTIPWVSAPSTSSSSSSSSIPSPSSLSDSSSDFSSLSSSSSLPPSSSRSSKSQSTHPVQNGPSTPSSQVISPVTRATDTRLKALKFKTEHNNNAQIKSTKSNEHVYSSENENINSDSHRTLVNINSHQQQRQQQQQTSLASSGTSSKHKTELSPSESRLPFKVTASPKDKKVLDALEKAFLRNFGLSERPKINSRFSVPQYMLDLYKTQVERPGGPSHFVALKGKGLIEANTVRTLFHDDVDSSKCRPPYCSRVTFDLSNIPEEETLTSAELRIYIDTPLSETTHESKRVPRDATHARHGAVSVRKGRTSPVDATSKQRIEIHEIMRPPSKDGDVISRLIDTKTVYPRHNQTWQSFDIHPAVLRWKRGSKHNYGLEIRLFPTPSAATSSSPSSPSSSSSSSSSLSSVSDNHHIRLRRSADIADSEWAQKRPFMVAFTNDGSSMPDSSAFSSSQSKHSRRMRRSSGKKKRKNRRKNRRRNNKRKRRRRKKKGKKNMCKRHAMYVDFKEVGWDDWIVAPAGYKANYCDGDCLAPLQTFTKASNHAVLQAQVYKVNPSAVPMVCCVPIAMSPISMLYQNEKNATIMKNYQDMIVDECGCK